MPYIYINITLCTKLGTTVSRKMTKYIEIWKQVGFWQKFTVQKKEESSNTEKESQEKKMMFWKKKFIYTNCGSNINSAIEGHAWSVA